MTLILANGSFPRRGTAAHEALATADRVVACDGAAEVCRRRTGREPDYTVGDLDSCCPSDRHGPRTVLIPEQDTNDLSKAISFCRARGWSDLLIVGATGKREDHTLGNIFRAMEAGVEVLTDCGRFIPFSGRLAFGIRSGSPVSVFATHPGTRMSSTGLEWPLDGLRFPNLYCATLNRAVGNRVEIVSDHAAFVYVPAPSSSGPRSSSAAILV